MAPRSIAQYLESKIANIEAREEHRTIASRSTYDEPRYFRNARSDTTSQNFDDNPIDKVMEDITPPFLGLTQSVLLARCIVAATQIPSAKKSFGVTDLDENHPKSIMNQQSSNVSLHSVPTHVASFLFDNYISRIQSQYPIFHTSEVVASFDAVYTNGLASSPPDSNASSRDVYVISLIMAISLSTAARNKQARAHSIATGLFRNAMLHIAVVLSNDLPGLQALLLLAQYTFLNPTVANLWLLTGLISEACIDLGLHQELPESTAINALERDMRRRVFWCAWEMEVAVCAGLLRPIRIQRKYISVAFPSELDDTAITLSGIDSNARVSKFISRRIWLFRQIESNIMSVLFQDEPLPSNCESVDAWMEEQELAIYEWNQEVHRSAASNIDYTIKSLWEEMLLYADIAYPLILVTMYRPSPRVKTPSRQNLMKAFAAAVRVAKGYWEQANTEFGNIKYVFHPCHHTFSSAVVFLHAMQSCKIEISERYSLEEVEDFMECFPRFFSTISERWPAASRCLEEYTRLLGPIKKEYMDFLRQKPNDNLNSNSMNYLVGEYFDPAMDLEDMVTFWSVFNPPMNTTGEDPLLSYSYVPNDWNAEFDFGMNFTTQNEIYGADKER